MSQVSIVDIVRNNPQIPTLFIGDIGQAIPIANTLEILGQTVANGTSTKAVYTTGSGNTITVNTQVAAAIAATDITKVGLASFNQDDFTVDANGFVSAIGGGDITINTDDGNFITATTFNLFGGKYKGIPVVSTASIAGDTLIYDNTFNTPYVVDPSVTDGSKGTFTTIQAALDAAFANGDSVSPKIAYIQIRTEDNSVYFTEDLNFVDTSQVFIDAVGSALVTNFQVIRVAVIGNHTMTGVVGLWARGIYFQAPTGFAFEPVSLQNTFFAECALNFNANGGAVNLYECLGIGTSDILDTPGLTMYQSNMATINIRNSGTGGGRDCTVNTLFFDNSTSFLGYFEDCDFGTVTGIVSNDIDFAPKFIECSFSHPVDVTGAVTFAECSAAEAGSSVANALYGVNVDAQIIPCQGGNVSIMKKVATDYQVRVSDQYIGVTDTSATRTMTMPDPTSLTLFKGQNFEFKDETGLANVNNITIDGNGLNIDGQPTFLINQIFGFITLMYDGTQYLLK